MQILKIFNQYKHWLLLGIITVFLVFSPTINLFFAKDFKWHGLKTITSVFHGRHSYYEARTKEIIDGYPLIGNPYFLEHNKEVPVAFFLADWISAVPMLLGASPKLNAAVNLLFWSLVFVFLSYGLLREISISKTVSVVGAGLAYLQVDPLMRGLVSMQTVFPFYLFFLLAFVLWLKDSARPRTAYLLIIATTLSFYIYTYLWLIVITVLVMSIFYRLAVKKRKEALCLAKMLVYVMIFSLPLFLLTYLQVTHPDYWDTMQRIGFVPTRMPTAEVYYSGRWVILILLLWLLSFVWSKEFKENQAYKLSFVFFALSGLSLIIVSASNVITGKELELAQHIVRFILVWAPLAIVAFLFFIKSYWKIFKSFEAYKKIILFFLCLVCVFGLASYYRDFVRGIFDTQEPVLQEIEEGRHADGALAWLENREKNPVVIWLNEQESSFEGSLLAMTKHYVLSSIGGALHLVSSKEVEERYLVTNYFNQLSLDDIKRDFKLYAGVGNAVHPYKIHNRKVILCEFFRLNLLGYNCGEKTDAFTLKGEKYFIDLQNKYKNEILPNIDYYLKKYHVAYFIRDRRINSDINPEQIGLELVYSDANFDIYKIKDF